MATFDTRTCACLVTYNAYDRITIRSTEAAGRAGFEINVVRRGSVNGDVSRHYAL